MRADGAVHLDTTPFTLDEVIEQVVTIVEEAAGEQPGPGR